MFFSWKENRTLVDGGGGDLTQKEEDDPDRMSRKCEADALLTYLNTGI